MKRTPIYLLLETVTKLFHVTRTEIRSSSHRCDIVFARSAFSNIAMQLGYSADFVGRTIQKTKQMVSNYVKSHNSYMQVREYEENYTQLTNFFEL